MYHNLLQLPARSSELSKLIEKKAGVLKIIKSREMRRNLLSYMGLVLGLNGIQAFGWEMRFNGGDGLCKFNVLVGNELFP